MDNLSWRYFCPGLTLRRWREECRLVEERFSLFRSFAGAPIVSRAGCEYHITVAAEMDMYPKYAPWIYVTPHLKGANADGKVRVDFGWSSDTAFADVIGAVTIYIEAAHKTSV